MAEDILGGIALARADMMMRLKDAYAWNGKLRVEIGPLTLRRLERDFATDFPGTVFGMPILVRDDREGFAVVPMQAGI